MAAIAGPNPSPEAPEGPPAGKPRLPWSRSEAFRFWMLAVATTALLETTVVAIGAAFPAASAPRPDSAQQTIRVLAVSALLPIVFLSLARFAEKKYQRRPPKALQVSQFSLYLAGTALVSAGFLRHRANLDPSLPLLFTGETLLGAAALLLAAWMASVLLCTPTDDTLTIP
ncbi:MAG TPA: hypothetical protein VLJ18_08565 [Thermoanaerobaculia bacterium]|nr:hypothetical protein [Thermoanaerobaculia bacterium]